VESGASFHVVLTDGSVVLPSLLRERQLHALVWALAVVDPTRMRLIRRRTFGMTPLMVQPGILVPLEDPLKAGLDLEVTAWDQHPLAGAGVGVDLTSVIFQRQPVVSKWNYTGRLH